VTPTARGWVVEKADFPAAEATTGMESISANRLSSCQASDIRTPPPARINGRRAVRDDRERGAQSLWAPVDAGRREIHTLRLCIELCIGKIFFRKDGQLRGDVYMDRPGHTAYCNPDRTPQDVRQPPEIGDPNIPLGDNGEEILLIINPLVRMPVLDRGVGIACDAEDRALRPVGVDEP